MFGKKPEEYVELGLDGEEKPLDKILLEVDKMTSYEDSERIQRKVRDGTILLVKVKDLKEKDMAELRRALERVKKTCMAIEGDIAGIGDDWVVVAPKVAKIHREKLEE
ncbi:MAG: cell division protein SepF [Candidatus Aenigmatarchaeota archaeon]